MAQLIHKKHNATYKASCCWVLDCVTTGSGINKIIFGKGTKLIIESSKSPSSFIAVCILLFTKS